MALPPAYPTLEGRSYPHEPTNMLSPEESTQLLNLAGQLANDKVQYKDIAKAEECRQLCLQMIEAYSHRMPPHYQRRWNRLIDRYRPASEALDLFESKQARWEGKLAWYQIPTQISLYIKNVRTAKKIKREFVYVKKRMATVSFQALMEEKALLAAGQRPINHVTSSTSHRSFLQPEKLDLLVTKEEKRARDKRRQKKANDSQKNVESTSANLSDEAPLPTHTEEPSLLADDEDEDDADFDPEVTDKVWGMFSAFLIPPSNPEMSTLMTETVSFDPNGGIELECRNGDDVPIMTLGMSWKACEAGDVDTEASSSPSTESPVPLESRNSWTESRSSVSTRSVVSTSSFISWLIDSLQLTSIRMYLLESSHLSFPRIVQVLTSHSKILGQRPISHTALEYIFYSMIS
ncbi:hypothetical protein DL96DRAFT_1609930 [Flagelloscypha sp. PMI_526]|nr:hypothetical protein DL96DRAFT_1609930 [Flagelloscypha sp. PMI_526]